MVAIATGHKRQQRKTYMSGSAWGVGGSEDWGLGEKFSDSRHAADATKASSVS